MKELAQIEIMVEDSRTSFSFACVWSGTREHVESELLEAQSRYPSVSWIAWRIGIDWNATVRGFDRGDLERFRAYLIGNKGWIERAREKKAG